MSSVVSEGDHRRRHAGARPGERDGGTLRRGGQVACADDAHAARPHVPGDPGDDRLGSATTDFRRAMIAVPAWLIEPVPAPAEPGLAQNTRPAYVSATARTARYAPASASRADRSATSWADRALRLCASRVMVATSRGHVVPDEFGHVSGSPHAS